MTRLPPSSTRTDTLLPYTTLFRSAAEQRIGWDAHVVVVDQGVRALALGLPGEADVAHDVHAGRVGRHQEHRHAVRSEEHTSELQSLMRNSYAVFCLKKKKNKIYHTIYLSTHPTSVIQYSLLN